MAKGMRLMLAITVDTDVWETAYGAGDDWETIKAHVAETVEEAVRAQFDAQANGSTLASVSTWRSR